MRMTFTAFTAAAIVTGACACGSAGQATPAGGAASPTSAPPPLPGARHFARTVDNPWFPLRPGTKLTYEGEDEGTPARDVFIVLHRTKRILGIRATVVFDRVLEHGRVVERTNDYYAQDRAGNVWYLGEDTATLRRDGS